MAAGTGGGWRGRRRRLLVAALVLAGGAVGVAGPWVWVRIASSGKSYAAADVPRTPVAIVFGAGLQPDGGPSRFLRYRLDIALQLYQQGRVEVILVSGDNRTSDHDEPTSMRDYLVRKGVPQERIVRDYAGRNTYDTCVRARRIFSVPSAVLVTQAYHLPRALALCNAVGVPAVGVPDEEAARNYPGLVVSYALREIGADVKAVWDIVSGREPVLGAPESSVTDALAAAGSLG